MPMNETIHTCFFLFYQEKNKESMANYGKHSTFVGER